MRAVRPRIALRAVMGLAVCLPASAQSLIRATWPALTSGRMTGSNTRMLNVVDYLIERERSSGSSDG